MNFKKPINRSNVTHRTVFPAALASDIVQDLAGGSGVEPPPSVTGRSSPRAMGMEHPRAARNEHDLQPTLQAQSL